MKEKTKEPSFEEALARLEHIAAAMEKEDVSLDSSLAYYEEGMKLMQVCHKKLNEAKKKVEVLVKTGAQEYHLEAFNEQSIGE